MTKINNRLRLAILANNEVLRGQVSDRLAVLDHLRIHSHIRHAGLKRDSAVSCATAGHTRSSSIVKHVIAGTAGHIDHGKTALVRALTGIETDRLEEEKRRGISIDIGFAHLDLAADLRVALIDVPGHERFIKNMLAGVGGIDFVIFVIAADESIKPQTREHFAICRLAADSHRG